MKKVYTIPDLVSATGLTRLRIKRELGDLYEPYKSYSIYELKINCNNLYKLIVGDNNEV